MRADFYNNVRSRTGNGRRGDTEQKEEENEKTEIVVAVTLWGIKGARFSFICFFV